MPAELREKTREVVEVEAYAWCETCGMLWGSRNPRGLLGAVSTHAGSRGHVVNYEQRQALRIQAGEPIPQMDLFEEVS